MKSLVTIASALLTKSLVILASACATLYQYCARNEETFVTSLNGEGAEHLVDNVRAIVEVFENVEEENYWDILAPGAYFFK